MKDKQKYYHLQRLTNDQWIWYGHIFDSLEDCKKEYDHWTEYDKVNKTSQYVLRIVSLEENEIISISQKSHKLFLS